MNRDANAPQAGLLQSLLESSRKGFVGTVSTVQKWSCFLKGKAFALHSFSSFGVSNESLTKVK